MNALCVQVDVPVALMFQLRGHGTNEHFSIFKWAPLCFALVLVGKMFPFFSLLALETECTRANESERPVVVAVSIRAQGKEEKGPWTV